MNIFMSTFRKLEKEGKIVDFKKEWHNGTGYLNNATKEALKEMCCTKDEFGRKIILIPIIVVNEKPELSPLIIQRTVAVFQRHSNKDMLLASNVPWEARQINHDISTDPIINFLIDPSEENGKAYKEEIKNLYSNQSLNLNVLTNNVLDYRVSFECAKLTLKS